MNTMPETDRNRLDRRWAYVPAGLLIAMLGGLLLMARIASDDPGFAVERDYYRKAVGWDAEQAQLAENQRLGWTMTAEALPRAGGRAVVRVGLRDGQGRPVTGARVTFEAFHNARAGDLRSGEARAVGQDYELDLGAVRPGLWELRLTAQAGTDRYTAVVRREIRGGS